MKKKTGSRQSYSAKRVEKNEEIAKNRILEVTHIGQMEKTVNDTKRELSEKYKENPWRGESQRFKKARSVNMVGMNES